MPEPTPETEQPCTESKFRKFGPVMFWGAVIALPAMNVTAAYFGYKDTKLQLELTKLKDIAPQA